MTEIQEYFDLPVVSYNYADDRIDMIAWMFVILIAIISV